MGRFVRSKGTRRPGVLLRIAEIFATISSGNPDHPGDRDGEDDPVPLHGILTESGIDIMTEGGTIIEAENQ